MGYRKKRKIYSAGYGGSIIGGGLITAFLTVIAGPIGFLGGLVLTGAALKDSYDSAKKNMDEVFSEEDEKKLLETYKNKDKFKVKITKHNTANNPPIPKLLFGNNITETIYYEKED